MKLKKIRAQNFMSFRELKIDIPDSGLYFIAGEIEDSDLTNSNGAGKSAIFEALCFGLFGATIRNAEKDDIINWKMNKNCNVNVEFTDNNDTEYLVRRFRGDEKSGNSLLFYKTPKNDVIKEITLSSARETQILIESVLGMNWLVFSSAIIFGERAQRFVEARDAEKKEIFDEILLLQKFQEAQRYAKDNVKEIDHNIEIIEIKISSFQSVVVSFQGEEKRIIDELEKITKIRKDSEKEIKLLDENLINLSEILKTKRDTLKIYEDEYNNAVKENSAIYNHIRELDKQKVDKLSPISTAVITTKTFIISLDRKINDINRQIDSVDKLTAGTKCSSCGQEITKFSKEEVFNHYQIELKKLLQEKNSYVDELKKHENIYVIENSYWEKQLNEATSVKRQLDDIVQEKKNIISCLTEKIGALGLEMVINENQIKEIKNELQIREETLIAEKNRITEQLKQKKEEMVVLISEIEKFRGNRLYYEFWERGFGNKGIKSFLLDEVLPLLNEKVSFYASALLGENVTIRFDTQMSLKTKDEVRDIFNVKVIRGDQVKNYASYSGGEKKRIDVAILMSLQNLIHQRTMCQYNIVVFDEIFDALDKTGIEIAAELLKEEAKEKAIFVISHSSELKDFFDNVWIVKKDKNEVSTLEI